MSAAAASSRLAEVGSGVGIFLLLDAEVGHGEIIEIDLLLGGEFFGLNVGENILSLGNPTHSCVAERLP